LTLPRATPRPDRPASRSPGPSESGRRCVSPWENHGKRSYPTTVASKAQVGMERPPPTLRIGSRSVPSGREWRGSGGRWLHPSRNPPSSDSNGGSAGELQGGRRTRGNMQKKNWILINNRSPNQGLMCKNRIQYFTKTPLNLDCDY